MVDLRVGRAGQEIEVLDRDGRGLPRRMRVADPVLRLIQADKLEASVMPAVEAFRWAHEVLNWGGVRTASLEAKDRQSISGDAAMMDERVQAGRVVRAVRSRCVTGSRLWSVIDNIIAQNESISRFARREAMPDSRALRHETVEMLIIEGSYLLRELYDDGWA